MYRGDSVLNRYCYSAGNTQFTEGGILMNQKTTSEYQEVISMEEYLDKRKRQKKNAPENSSKMEATIPVNVAWAFAEMYI